MLNLTPKRVTLFCGHYGTGKTNAAVNYAFFLKRALGKNVKIADMDIVNPYFRTKDSEKERNRWGRSPKYRRKLYEELPPPPDMSRKRKKT